MPPYNKPSIKDILQKYGARIEGQFNTQKSGGNYSQEYSRFKAELAPELTRYERLCRGFGSAVKINASKKDQEEISKQLNIAHLDVEPWQALSFAIVSFFSVFLIGILGSVAIMMIKGGSSISAMLGNFPILFFILISVFSLFLFYFVKAYPQRLANKWRLKASSQMVPAILYVVVYMRHTPNLEKAIAFAAEHLQEPLALDFKKVFL